MKTSHTSLLKISGILITLLCGSKAFAVQYSMQGSANYPTWEEYQASHPGNSTDTNSVQGCQPVSNIKFMNLMQFVGPAKCVTASTDAQASPQCASFGLHANPGNPQYNSGVSGQLGSNSANYYYCIQADPRNRKKNMCENIAKLKYGYLSYDFREIGGDGDCYCGYGNTDTKCNDVNEVARAAKATACGGVQNPFVDQSRAYDADDLSSANGTYNRANLYCKCSDQAPEDKRGTYETAPVTAAHCGYTGAALAAAQTPEGATAPPSEQQEFDRCLADYRQRAMDCESQANTARNTCREKIESGRNSPLSIAGNMVGALGQVGIAANAGSGNQQNCFGAGVGMMGVREALQLGRESCESEFATCQNTCRQENFDQMLTECPSKLRDPATRQPLTQAQLLQRNDENAQTLQRTREELQRMITEGARICENDAGGAAQDMSRMMNGLGNSIQQSMVCACNLSSAPSANCNNIPTIQSCEVNPSLPNCQIYGGVDTCNPTSPGFNQQMCNCVQNPSSCTTVSGTPPPSLFGSNLKNPFAPNNPNGFAGNLAGGGSGGGRGSYDLGGEVGSEAQVALAGPQFGAGARGGAAGGGMGMGGAGGGAAGGPGADGALKGEVQEKGLSGLFNQAKTALRGALGFGKPGAGSKNAAALKKPARKVDLTKFKPRNLASSGRNGIGTANMDIFGMIKMCAQGDTCETNRPKSAWILTP